MRPAATADHPDVENADFLNSVRSNDIRHWPTGFTVKVVLLHQQLLLRVTGCGKWLLHRMGRATAEGAFLAGLHPLSGPAVLPARASVVQAPGETEERVASAAGHLARMG
eukprot:gene13175-13306_t